MQRNNIKDFGSSGRGFDPNKPSPPRIGFQAFSELISKSFDASGIHRDLIPDQFQQETSSEYGDIELTGLKPRLGWVSLDDETKNRWSKEIVAYWFVNEDNTDWQAILNLPEIKDGVVRRPYSYIAPKGLGDSVFFPPIPYSIRKLISERFNIPIGGDPTNSIPTEGSFWTWWGQHGYKLMPLLITEGGKKVLALLSQGIPAIGLYGCSCGVIEVLKTNKKGVEETSFELKEVLRPFCKPGGVVIIALDNDSQAKSSTYRKTEIAKNRLWVALKNEGCKSYRMVWSADHKGVDDLIVGDPEHFGERLELALYPQELSTITGMRETLLIRYGSRIQFNLMSQKIEIDGTRLTLNQPKTAWNTVLGLSGNYAACDIVDAVSGYALERSYHPVRKYLEEIEKDESIQPFPLKEVARYFLDTLDELNAVLVMRWLIAAVARIFEPGCQVDTMLIFQGAMGLQKSKFFRVLAKCADWFSQGVSSSKASEKDQKITLHAGWIHDLGEVGSIYQKREIQEFRQFVSATHDEFRPPYARESEVFARRFVFCGTANENDFMADSYGSRRWWVIPVSNRIILPSEAEIDAIWKAAVMAYRQGEQWWLTDLEDAMNTAKNLEFYGEDPWKHLVLGIVGQEGHRATMRDILDKMKLEPTQRTRRETDRIAAILRLNGYDNTEKNQRGDRVWKLKRPEGSEERETWLQPIENYLDGRDQVTVTEILQNAIQIGTERHGRRESDRAVKVLKQLGWTRQQVRQGPERGKYFWVKGTQEYTSENLDSNLYSTSIPVPEPVSDNMEYRNTGHQEDKSRGLSKNGENSSKLNPSADSRGNPSTPETSFSTEQESFKKTGLDIFHSELETPGNQTQNGIEPMEYRNTAIFRKEDETSKIQHQSGLQAPEERNLAQDSYIPLTTLPDLPEIGVVESQKNGPLGVQTVVTVSYNGHKSLGPNTHTALSVLRMRLKRAEAIPAELLKRLDETLNSWGQR